jgi:Class III cytochrome C family
MRKAGVGAAAVVLLAVLVFFAVSSWGRQPTVAVASVQPINFPHSVHVQTYKIDCQYCHADARRSEYAGIPSVERCMGCHKITAADKPEIKKLAEFAAKQQPIPWTRVYKLPEFTYFPHKAHIRAELACQTCGDDDDGGRHHRPHPRQRYAQPRGTPAGTAAADHGLVHRLSPAAERHPGHPGAPGLRDVPSLTEAALAARPSRRGESHDEVVLMTRMGPTA